MDRDGAVGGSVFSEQSFAEVIGNLQSKGVFRVAERKSESCFQVRPHQHVRTIKLAMSPRGILGTDSTRILFPPNPTVDSVEQMLTEAMKKYS